MTVGLSENVKKEELSMCYSHALASCCGLNFEKPRIDNDSVDVELVLRGMKTHWIYSSPRLFIQFKATSSALFDKDGNLKFKINKKNYDDLRRPSQVHRILVVFCLPRDKKSVEYFTTHVLLNGFSFWLSLHGMPQLKQRQQNITLTIPKSNVISDNTFIKMLENSACNLPLEEGLS